VYHLCHCLAAPHDPTRFGDLGAAKQWHTGSGHLFHLEHGQGQHFLAGCHGRTITGMSTGMAIADDSAAIWQRVIHFDEELSPAAARALLKLRFSERDRALMNELSTKGTCRYPDARGAKPARHFRAAGLVARHRPFQRPAGAEEKAQEGWRRFALSAISIGRR